MEIKSYKQYLQSLLNNNIKDRLGCNKEKLFFQALSLFFKCSHNEIHWFIEDEKLMENISDECLNSIAYYLTNNGNLYIYVNKDKICFGKLRNFLKDHNCSNLKFFKYAESLKSLDNKIYDFIIFDDINSIIHDDPYNFQGTIYLNNEQKVKQLKRSVFGNEI